MFEIVKNERYSIAVVVAVIAISVCSYYLDCSTETNSWWFQRSGAWLILAGVALQYMKVRSLWNAGDSFPALSDSALDPMIPESARRVGGMTEIESHTWSVTEKTHDLVTGKSHKESVAVALVVLGTVISAYGDIPFR